MTNQLIPRLRFKQFNKQWNENKLGNISHVTKLAGFEFTKYVNYKDNGNIIALRGLNVKHNTLDLSNVKYIDNSNFDKLTRSKLYIGDILFTYVGTVGNSAMINENNKYYLAPNVALIRLKNNNPKFFQQMISTSKFYKKIIYPLASSSSQMALSMYSIRQFKVKYPTFSEQQHIGTFFAKLDRMIELQSKKITHLKQLKKGYLQKMFPQKNEDVPRLRFNSFHNKWNKNKLGNLADIIRGASPRPISNPKWFNNNSNVGWLRISDVTSQHGKVKYIKQRISKLGESKTRVLTTPHLLLSIAATVGEPVINYTKTGVHDGFIIFKNPKFNKEYMFQWLIYFKNHWKQYGQPGSQINLNSSIVSNQKIKIPSLEEQNKISQFFKHFDKSISQQKNKLNQLKRLKKAYLQKMFI